MKKICKCCGKMFENNDQTKKMSYEEYLLAYVKGGSAKYTKIMLDNGADPNYVNENGNSLLMIAVMNNNPEIVKLLLEYGATGLQKNISGQSPLDLAIYKIYKSDNNMNEVIKLLVKHEVPSFHVLPA